MLKKFKFFFNSLNGCGNEDSGDTANGDTPRSECSDHKDCSEGSYCVPKNIETFWKDGVKICSDDKSLYCTNDVACRENEASSTVTNYSPVCVSLNGNDVSGDNPGICYQPTKCETTDDCDNNENLEMLTCIPQIWPEYPKSASTVGPGKCFPLPAIGGVKSKCAIDADCGNDEYGCYAYHMDEAIDPLERGEEPFITPKNQHPDSRKDEWKGFCMNKNDYRIADDRTTRMRNEAEDLYDADLEDCDPSMSFC